jgi:curved DNA-binding protein CbpA
VLAVPFADVLDRLIDAGQLHPDMHPSAGEFDRCRLATEFAAVREAYDLLLA